jgi:hypothetical protein
MTAIPPIFDQSDRLYPPEWHAVADSQDKYGMTFFANTGLPTYSTFTSSNFDNGDGTSQNFFGPLSFCKDGWWCHAAGMIAIPVGTAAYDIKVCNIPDPFRPKTGKLPAFPVIEGIWGGATNNGAYIDVFDTGDFRIATSTAGHLANATWAAISGRWVTNIFGEG